MHDSCEGAIVGVLLTGRQILANGNGWPRGCPSPLP